VSVLWILPLAFFAVGILVVTAALRNSAVAAADLRDECARLEEVRLSLVDLRNDADAARAAIEQVRSRGSRPTPDR
jgi:hypothetical protein